MSINNLHKSYFTNSTLDYSSVYSTQQRVIQKLEDEKPFLEDSSSNRDFEQQKKQATESSKFYLNVAHELSDELVSDLEDTDTATFLETHPSLFSGSSYMANQYNLIDLKRHQNYFDQMMNFDTPSGSWIDQNV